MRSQARAYKHGAHVTALDPAGVKRPVHQPGGGHGCGQRGGLGRRGAVVQHGHLRTLACAPARNGQARGAQAQDKDVLTVQRVFH